LRSGSIRGKAFASIDADEQLRGGPRCGRANCGGGGPAGRLDSEVAVRDGQPERRRASSSDRIGKRAVACCHPKVVCLARQRRGIRHSAKRRAVSALSVISCHRVGIVGDGRLSPILTSGFVDRHAHVASRQPRRGGRSAAFGRDFGTGSCVGRQANVEQISRETFALSNTSCPKGPERNMRIGGHSVLIAEVRQA
jgi:hypothetical protein